ncbi:MAG: hypothetical protein IJ060_00545 [Oscillospiraceae bacterium]|nr:hypothetical protein [Oscillospiraceae bacterium]
MFLAADGFVHLLIANPDDSYYTPNLIRMQFLPCLRYRIYCAEPEFRNIFLLYDTPKGSDHDYRMQWVGGQSIAAMEPEQKKKLFGGLFSKREDTNTKRDAAAGEEFLDEDGLADRVRALLNVMKQKNATALAMPGELLGRVAEQNPDIQRQLADLIAHNRSNVLILTVSPRAAEADPLFRWPEQEKDGKGTGLPPGLLLQPYLFPELIRQIKGADTYRVMRYEMLRSALGNRLHCWNALAYEDVRAAVRYAYFRHPEWENCGKSDLFAAILWGWHSTILFRDRCAALGCRDNPRRMLDVLVQNLEDPAFRLRITELAQEELLTDPGQLLSQLSDTMQPGMQPILMQRAESGQDFVSTLTQYRSVLRGHEKLLSEEELTALLEMTEAFAAPDYLHPENWTEPAYCEFRNPDCQKALRILFDYLKKQPQWNNWDKGIMYALYHLFLLCRDDAESRIGTDDQHLACKKAIQIIITGKTGAAAQDKEATLIRYCLRKSENAPYEDAEASKLTRRTVHVLGPQNYRTSKDFYEAVKKFGRDLLMK